MSYKGTNSTYDVGSRVEVHPATDAWMSGDRLGIVLSVAPISGRAAVCMDRSGRVLRFSEQNIWRVLEWR